MSVTTFGFLGPRYLELAFGGSCDHTKTISSAPHCADPKEAMRRLIFGGSCIATPAAPKRHSRISIQQTPTANDDNDNDNDCAPLSSSTNDDNMGALLSLPLLAVPSLGTVRVTSGRSSRPVLNLV
jgi:hypothetical protein